MLTASHSAVCMQLDTSKLSMTLFLRLLGFRIAPPVVGRRINLTALWPVTSPALRETFFQDGGTVMHIPSYFTCEVSPLVDSLSGFKGKTIYTHIGSPSSMIMCNTLICNAYSIYCATKSYLKYSLCLLPNYTRSADDEQCVLIIALL